MCSDGDILMIKIVAGIALAALSMASIAEVGKPFEGEWSLDKELCEVSRVFWKSPDKHGSMIAETGAGQWQELTETTYQLDGNVMTYAVHGVTEKVRITMDGVDRLTLENLDREPPDNAVSLVRCQ